MMKKLVEAIGPEEVLFSVKAFIAAMLALWIALALGLKNPYWATSTVYIVAQPLASVVTSKALYRTLGTITGAIVTVVLVPNLADAPELLTLAMALWLTVCVFVSLIDRTPRSYVFVLAGYTAAIIGFPSVMHPDAVFDTAIARVEEIMLGITCSAAVSRLLLPRAMGPMLAGQIDDWLRDAGEWALDVLGGESRNPRAGEHRHRLAQDAVDLVGPVSQLSFDTSHFRFAAEQVKALQQRMVALLPQLSAIGDRLEERAKSGRPLDTDLRELLSELSIWIGAGREAAETQAQHLRRLAAAAKDRRSVRTGEHTREGAAEDEWGRLVELNLVGRLADLVDVWDDCLRLRRDVEAGAERAPRRLRAADRYAAAPGLHRDYGLAFSRAMPVFVFTLVIGAFWIATGWQDGAFAAMIGAIFCAIFSSQEDQVGAMKQLFVYAIFSTVAAAVYQFGILPGIGGYPLLVMVLAPYLLFFGALLPSATFGMLGFLMCVNPQVEIQLGTPLNLDFAAFMNSNLALVAGIGFATFVVALVRPLGVEQSAQRIMNASWTDIARLASGARETDIGAFLRRQVDRLGLIVPRLAVMREEEGVTPDHVLAELQVGINIAELQRERHALLPGQEEAVARLLRALGNLFGAPRPQPPQQRENGNDVLPLIDEAIGKLNEGRGTARETSLMALVGIRRGLVPDAPAWRGRGVRSEERMVGWLEK